MQEMLERGRWSRSTAGRVVLYVPAFQERAATKMLEEVEHAKQWQPAGSSRLQEGDA